MTKCYNYSHEWQDAPSVLSYLQDSDVIGENADFVLLHSAMKTSYSGRYSWLCFDARNVCSGDDFQSFKECLSKSSGAETSPINRLFGYLGYELMGDGTSCQASYVVMPNFYLAQFNVVLCFDNQQKTIAEYSTNPQKTDLSKIDLFSQADKKQNISIENINSNMSREEYLQTIEETLEEIRAGSFYQANITRKFFGDFVQKPDATALFKRLCEVSPAPYSACMRLDSKDILSSSPELFLKIDKNGKMLSRPIKGTLGIEQGSADDLAASEKDKAENLMIVDLMRNDFSRTAKGGSVAVDSLYEIDKFATLYHMSSNITAQLAADKNVADAVEACFPAGSMTGTPKIAAMEHCAKKEQMSRGVYSGSIGWLDSNSCEMSVVIRTLLIDGRKFEFQVGGAIVADSKPEKELQEIIVKASGLLAALGVDSEIIEGI